MRPDATDTDAPILADSATDGDVTLARFNNRLNHADTRFSVWCLALHNTHMLTKLLWEIFIIQGREPDQNTE